MQSSPTTTQILEGIRVDLRAAVLPELTPGPARVALEMLDNLLANLGTRAAHEIAWMRDECQRIEALVAGVDDPATQAALADYQSADLDSLHLDAVQAAYDRAGEVLSCALEHALARDDRLLLGAARELLGVRNEREMAIMGDWNLVGRG